METVDAIILGYYDGNMIATGNVEIAATGRVSGNIKTDSLVISKGGGFRGNVAKIHEDPAATHRPPYLVEEQLAGQNGPREFKRTTLPNDRADDCEIAAPR